MRISTQSMHQTWKKKPYILQNQLNMFLFMLQSETAKITKTLKCKHGLTCLCWTCIFLVRDKWRVKGQGAWIKVCALSLWLTLIASTWLHLHSESHKHSIRNNGSLLPQRLTSAHLSALSWTARLTKANSYVVELPWFQRLCWFLQ